MISDEIAILNESIRRANSFEQEAHRILAYHETSKSRVIKVEETYSKLSKLSITQDGLLREALKCVEFDLNRAATVLSWAAFMDFLQCKLGEDGYVKLNKAYPKWNIKSSEDLQKIRDFQLIVAGSKVELYKETIQKALQGLLSKRNECAHPSPHSPDYNESLGYISEIISRIKTLQKRSLK